MSLHGYYARSSLPAQLTYYIMVIQRPLGKLSYVGNSFSSTHGVILIVKERILLKKRWLLPNKYQDLLRFFWRPCHAIADKKFFKYVEYGNARSFYINHWFEIKCPTGIPQFDKFLQYPILRVLDKQLITVLYKMFAIKIPPN